MVGIPWRRHKTNGTNANYCNSNCRTTQIPAPNPPLPAAIAYPERWQLRFLPTLIVLILTFCFLASIPAYLCFSATPPSPGLHTDANFYQLLSGSVLQFLSIVTLIWPTVFHTRLSRMAWLWTWMLAGISTVCAGLSLALYVWVSEGWSSVVGCFGQASICVVSLLLIFRV